MNLFKISLIILFLSGCSVVGEKEVLTAKNSEWKINTLFSRVTYKYQCESSWVQLDEVVFSNHTSSY